MEDGTRTVSESPGPCTRNKVRYYGLLASLLGARTLLGAPGLTTSYNYEEEGYSEQRASLFTSATRSRPGAYDSGPLLPRSLGGGLPPPRERSECTGW